MRTKKVNSSSMYSFYTPGSRESRMTAFAEKLINTRIDSLKESLSDFSGSDHKLEQITTLSGITFINDARATNSNAVWFSLSSMTKPTAWIMSINDVAQVDENLLKEVRRVVKTIILCGVYNQEVSDFFTQMGFKVHLAMNIEEATKTAYYSSVPGQVVLFSPGNSSIASLETYRERGEKFRVAVAQL
jgi:UDP-N-acetylmuramoylalanine--D-glutamate ligase